MLFQIAAARRLVKSSGVPIVANMAFTAGFIEGSAKEFVLKLLAELNITLTDARPVTHVEEVLKAKLAGVPVIGDGNARKAIDKIAPRKGAMMSGYFQDWSLFQDDILALLPPVRNLLERSTNEPTWAPGGSIHLRLGDYASLRRIYGEVTNSYISASLSRFAPDPISEALPIRVFSNQLKLAQTNLKGLPYDFEFVDEPDPLTSLRALSSSSWIVGSNSTFSWWAAAIGGFTRLSLPSPYLLKKRLDSRIKLNSPNVLQLPRQ